MPIRFAILGAGRIGQVHARAVAGNDDAVLAAVFDPVAEAASADLDAIWRRDAHCRRDCVRGH